MTKKNQKILNIMLKVLLALLVVFFIIYTTLSLIEPKKIINTFKYQHFVIQTNSMEPIIDVGDLIIVKKIDFNELKEDDIISFYADINYDGKKEIVTHYFDSIEIGENNQKIYHTRRANTTNLDSWVVLETDIIGEYVNKIPKIGKVIMFIQEPIGMGVFLIDLVIIYLIIKLTSTNKEEKSIKEIDNKKE